MQNFKLACVLKPESPNERLHVLRNKARMSIREAGEIAGVSHSLISKFERVPEALNEFNPRHRDVVKRLARHLHVHPQYIWAGADIRPLEVGESRSEYDSGTPKPEATPSHAIPTTTLVFLVNMATDDSLPPPQRSEAKQALLQLIETLSP